MSGKIAIQRAHTGTLRGEQSQAMSLRTAQKVNSISTSLEARVAALEELQKRTTIPMGNANKSITPAQMARWVIRATGALTAARTINGFRHPTSDDNSYTRLIFNNTTGGFNLTVTTGTGTNGVIGAGGSAVAQFSPTGVTLYVL